MSEENPTFRVTVDSKTQYVNSDGVVDACDHITCTEPSALFSDYCTDHSNDVILFGD